MKVLFCWLIVSASLATVAGAAGSFNLQRDHFAYGNSRVGLVVFGNEGNQLFDCQQSGALSLQKDFPEFLEQFQRGASQRSTRSVLHRNSGRESFKTGQTQLIGGGETLALSVEHPNDALDHQRSGDFLHEDPFRIVKAFGNRFDGGFWLGHQQSGFQGQFKLTGQFGGHESKFSTLDGLWIHAVQGICTSTWRVSKAYPAGASNQRYAMNEVFA